MRLVDQTPDFSAPPAGVSPFQELTTLVSTHMMIICLVIVDRGSEQRERWTCNRFDGPDHKQIAFSNAVNICLSGTKWMSDENRSGTTSKNRSRTTDLRQRTITRFESLASLTSHLRDCNNKSSRYYSF
jgi:hypothetical protein